MTNEEDRMEQILTMWVLVVYPILCAISAFLVTR